MSEPAIRPAAIVDLPSVEHVVRDAYAKYVDRIGKKPGPLLDDYRQRIREHAVWVLAASGTIVGIVVLQPEADHLLLANVAVATNFQGRGLGRRLIDFAESEARRRGYDEIRLYTHQRMYESAALYPRLGYEETGRAEEDGFPRVFFRKRLG
jgi:ribosomal protein S18 acetylase RimI-like enzyme